MIPKSGYRFSETSCCRNKLERDDASKKSRFLQEEVSPAGDQKAI